MFNSHLEVIDQVAMPMFSGLRIMHMPFITTDASTIRGVADRYRGLVEHLCKRVPAGVGYLTIDECELKAGEHHRRPGLHVDGVDETGESGGWGADPGKGGWGASGMLLVSSHVGCRAWSQSITGSPKPNGDCEHLRDQCGVATDLQPGSVYKFGPMTLHESVGVNADCKRQFVRLSFPSDAAWYEGYTVNPNGVQPTGEIRKRREFMDYRP